MDSVKITDLSSYEPGKSSNGGCYLFTQKYKKTEEGYEARYYSSAEFSYCDILGVFQECSKCRDFDTEERKCFLEPTIISPKQLKQIITQAQIDEHMIVEIDVF